MIFKSDKICDYFDILLKTTKSSFKGAILKIAGWCNNNCQKDLMIPTVIAQIIMDKSSEAIEPL